MRQPVSFGALAVIACVAIAGWRLVRQSSPETFSDPKATPPEAAPLCPWREPEADLKGFFPGATRYEAQTRILSGRRQELAQHLGRTLTGDENALRFCRVYRDEEFLGTILTRRAKGEYGGIELVLATDTNRCVRGLRLQRLREPEPIANALQNTNWLRSFGGKQVDDPWRLGSDLPEVPSEARASAGAVAQGVRSLLILLAAADGAETPSLAATHHD